MTDLEPKAPPARPPLTVSDPPARARKEASWALLALGVLQLAFGAMSALLPRLMGATTELQRPMLGFGTMLALAVAFLGLGFWARTRPVPAAFLGLVLYAAVTAFNWALGLLLVLLALLLIRSIWTCLRARQP